MKRVFAWVFILALLTQVALGEVVNVDRTALYQSEKKFSMSGDAKVMQMAFNGTLGKLTVDAQVLDKSTYNRTQELIVQTGTWVSFSYDSISTRFGEKENQWHIKSDGARKIGSLDFGNKIGMGGILVQKSHDGSKWETAFQKCDVFKDYPYSVRDFYTTSRNDLNNGCYYRVTIAYKTEVRTKKDNLWLFDTSKYEARWHVETYEVYLSADDYSVKNTSNGNLSPIQNVYYSTPSKTLDAYFGNDTFRYMAENNMSLAIEVPSDQYDQCVELARRRIANGKLPGITDPNEAENIIVNSSITYQQAVSIARTGKIDCLKYQASTGAVTSTASFGIKSVIEYAYNIWNGAPYDDALQNAILTDIVNNGSSFIVKTLSNILVDNGSDYIIDMLTNQVMSRGLNSLLVPSSEALFRAIGYKATAAIVNLTRIGLRPIYGAAALKSAAKMLRFGVVGNTITMFVLSVPDAIDVFRGRISVKQLVKNLSVTAGGITGGFAGLTAGAAAGAAAGSLIPGAGTAVGAVFGAVGGLLGGFGGSFAVEKLADLISDDDAVEMQGIMNAEFANLTKEYLLNDAEQEKISNALLNNLESNGGLLKDMFASPDRNKFARELITPLVMTVVNARKKITLPDEKTIEKRVIDVLEELNDAYEELEN